MSPKPFNPAVFLIVNAVNVVTVFAIISFLVPNTWAYQFSASWQLLLGTFVAVHFFNAFVEFFIHRYVLHMPVIPFFKKFHVDHTLHHRLTDITKDGALVYNEYPIEKEHQHEASFMPWFSYFLFSIFYTPFFIVVWLINPEIPIFLAGYSAGIFSFALYELSHAMVHWPLKTWKKLLAMPVVGPVWRIIYKHHMRHHVDIRYNESVFGFFGLPISDWVFGTHIPAKTLFPHGETVPESEFIKPKPSAFICWLDKILLKVSKI